MGLNTFQKLVILGLFFTFGLALVALVFGILAYRDTDDTDVHEVHTRSATLGVEIPEADSTDAFLVPKAANSSAVEWKTRPHSHGVGKHPVHLHLVTSAAAVPSSNHDYAITTDVFKYLGDSLHVRMWGVGLTGPGDDVTLSVVQGIAVGTFQITGTAHQEWLFDLTFEHTALSPAAVQVTGHLHQLDNVTPSRLTTVSQTIPLDPKTAFSLRNISGVGTPTIHGMHVEFRPKPA